MIERLSGIVLDVVDAQYLVEALDALLVDRRPSARLVQFISQLRKSVAKSGVSGQNAGVDARLVGVQEDSAHYALYDVVDTCEAAAILGITANGVRDLARRKALPAHRAGGRWLFPAAAVVARAERQAARKAG